MPKKRYKAEEIIHKLQEADVLLSQGMNVGQVSKRIVTGRGPDGIAVAERPVGLALRP